MAEPYSLVQYVVVVCSMKRDGAPGRDPHTGEGKAMSVGKTVATMIVFAWANLPAVGEPTLLEPWQPISYLPLAGSLVDEVAGGQAAFTRESNAFNRDGSVSPPHTIRTELVTVEAGRSCEFIVPDVPSLRPFFIGADGLFYGSTGSDIYTSPDGHTWSPIGEVPGYIRSMFGTSTGTILVSAGNNGNARVYRRDPAGGTFMPVLDLEYGKLLDFNFVDTGAFLFISEYGPKRPPNSRRIYRSDDDGITWDVVYDPEYRYTHNHRIFWDPYDSRVLQTTGDGAGNHLFIVSEDSGESWDLKPLHFPTTPPGFNLGGPTAALAHPDAVYWGIDSAEASGVRRQDRATNRWESVLYLGPESPAREDMFHGQVYDMTEWGGLMYAPLLLVRSQPRPNGLYVAPALYTSADGTNWALAKRFGPDQAGIQRFLGEKDGRLWARYQLEIAGYEQTVLALDPPVAHRLIRGTRLEGEVANLWDTPEASSAEGTVAGWTPYGGAALEIDTTRAFHGWQSVHVICPEARRAGVVLPPYSGQIPADSTVSVLAHVYGKPRVMRLQIDDDAGNRIADVVFGQMCEQWTRVFCRGQLRTSTTSLTARIYQRSYDPGLEFWVDGVMLSVGRDGDTWQLGGEPRTADHAVYDFDFPSTWTDLFLWAPDTGTDGPDAPMRTLKVYEGAEGRTLSVVYDPDDNIMRLIDTSDAGLTVETPGFLLVPGAVLGVGVVQAEQSRTLFVKIAEEPYVGAVSAAPFTIVRMHIGSDPYDQHACGGVQARHKLFDQAADVARLEQLFVELISSPN